MSNLLKRITYFLIVSTLLLTDFSYASYGSSIYDYFAKPIARDPSVEEIGGTVGGIFQYIGFFAAVLSVFVTGLGFLIASPQKKAMLKEKLWLIAIGVFILAGGNSLYLLLGNFALEISK